MPHPASRHASPRPHRLAVRPHVDGALRHHGLRSAPRVAGGRRPAAAGALRGAPPDICDGCVASTLRSTDPAKQLQMGLSFATSLLSPVLGCHVSTAPVMCPSCLPHSSYSPHSPFLSPHRSSWASTLPGPRSSSTSRTCAWHPWRSRVSWFFYFVCAAHLVRFGAAVKCLERLRKLPRTCDWRPWRSRLSWRCRVCCPQGAFWGGSSLSRCVCRPQGPAPGVHGDHGCGAVYPIGANEPGKRVAPCPANTDSACPTAPAVCPAAHCAPCQPYCLQRWWAWWRQPSGSSGGSAA